MRRLFTPFLLALLVTTPLAAQAQITVSSFSCRPAIPCDVNSPQFPSASSLIAGASTCVSRYMSPVQGVTIFNDAAGLDFGNCLTTNPEAFPATGAGPTIPHCCIKKFQADICVVQCDVQTE